MPHRLPLLALMLLAAPVMGQSAEERYHEAAQAYIAGETEAARAAVTEGLRLEPQNPRLTALLALLDTDEPPPAGVGAAGDDGAAQDGPPDDGDDPNDSGDEQDASDGARDDEGDEGDASRGNGASQALEGTMSSEEADRILRAIEEDEQDVLRDVTRRRTSNQSQEKDW